MTLPAYIIIAAITATAAAVIAHLALLLKRRNQTSNEYLALLHNIAESLDNRAAGKARIAERVTGAEVRLCRAETTMARVETKVDRIVTKVEKKFHCIDAKIEKGFDRIGAKLDRTDAKIDRILERLAVASPAQQE